MSARRAVVVRTPAKINLALMVGPVRPDGFHDLASVYQAVGCYDDVRAEPARAGEITVTVSGPGAGEVPLGRANLAVRAARMLADERGIDEGVRLDIRKGIPVAGGMAGGSSDAAAALVACDAIWETKLDGSDLLAVAARLGSDVPFCVLGGTALGAGHGELVSPLPVRGDYAWVLVFDTDGLSTPSVYAGLDEQRAGAEVAPPKVPEELLTALRLGDLPAVGRSLINELEPVALAMRPRLREVLEIGTGAGAIGALVSGSGPTCALLAPDPDQAEGIARAVGRAIADRWPGTRPEISIATGPVPGARPV